MAEPFDAIVVGSGATGGCAAKELTEAGLSVALLEAGPEVPFAGEGSRAQRGRVGARRGDRRTPRQQRTGRRSRRAATPTTSAPLTSSPTTSTTPTRTPEDKPFDWIRNRVVGGRLHTWGRMCLRMSDWELKAASRDGIGEDWPISYADLRALLRPGRGLHAGLRDAGGAAAASRWAVRRAASSLGRRACLQGGGRGSLEQRAA